VGNFHLRHSQLLLVGISSKWNSNEQKRVEILVEKGEREKKGGKEGREEKRGRKKEEEKKDEERGRKKEEERGEGGKGREERKGRKEGKKKLF